MVAPLQLSRYKTSTPIQLSSLVKASTTRTTNTIARIPLQLSSLAKNRVSTASSASNQIKRLGSSIGINYINRANSIIRKSINVIKPTFDRLISKAKTIKPVLERTAVTNAKALMEDIAKKVKATQSTPDIVTKLKIQSTGSENLGQKSSELISAWGFSDLFESWNESYNERRDEVDRERKQQEGLAAGQTPEQVKAYPISTPDTKYVQFPEQAPVNAQQGGISNIVPVAGEKLLYNPIINTFLSGDIYAKSPNAYPGFQWVTVLPGGELKNTDGDYLGQIKGSDLYSFSKPDLPPTTLISSIPSLNSVQDVFDLWGNWTGATVEKMTAEYKRNVMNALADPNWVEVDTVNGIQLTMDKSKTNINDIMADAASSCTGWLCDLYDNVAGAVGSAVGAIQNIINVDTGAIGAALAPLGAAVSGMLTSIKSMAEGMFATVGKIPDQIIESVGKAFTWAVETMKPVTDMLGKELNVIENMIGTIWDKVKGFATWAVETAFNKVLPLIEPIAAAMLTTISPVLSMIGLILSKWDEIPSLIQGALDWISTTYQTVIDGFNKMWEWITTIDWQQEIMNKMIEIMGYIGEALLKMAEAIVPTPEELVDIMSQIGDTARDYTDKVVKDFCTDPMHESLS